MAKPDLNEMIANARGRIPPKPKPVEWWKFPKTDGDLKKFEAEEAEKDAKRIKYIPGARPAEKGGLYEEETEAE